MTKYTIELYIKVFDVTMYAIEFHIKAFDIAMYAIEFCIMIFYMAKQATKFYIKTFACAMYVSDHIWHFYLKDPHFYILRKITNFGIYSKRRLIQII